MKGVLSYDSFVDTTPVIYRVYDYHGCKSFPTVVSRKFSQEIVQLICLSTNHSHGLKIRVLTSLNLQNFPSG